MISLIATATNCKSATSTSIAHVLMTRKERKWSKGSFSQQHMQGHLTANVVMHGGHKQCCSAQSKSVQSTMQHYSGMIGCKIAQNDVKFCVTFVCTRFQQCATYPFLRIQHSCYNAWQMSQLITIAWAWRTVQTGARTGSRVLRMCLKTMQWIRTINVCSFVDPLLLDQSKFD